MIRRPLARAVGRAKTDQRAVEDADTDFEPTVVVEIAYRTKTVGSLAVVVSLTKGPF